ncbi:DUF4091 domain-containing protein [Neobacillus sp. NPDC058068]|uniref:DUF4091 domain-containing protein n=1 Tax=Neobacillus sp. NPDC058068 TaxID=3346325 RepID=UPI0036DA89AA
MKFETRLISPLEKVFPDEELKADSYNSSSALIGEYVSFQLAVKADDLKFNVTIDIESEIKNRIEIGSIGLVPSIMPNYKDHDGYLLRTKPGLYPDPILPGNKFSPVHEQWNSFWIYVNTKDLQSGKYEIKFNVVHEDKIEAFEVFALNLLDVKMANHGLKRTEWFYLDCIADHHHVEMLSDEHFEIIGNYIDNYVEHEINMILTPLFSPALEMFVDGDRPTVQLVGIEKMDGEYSFDFTLLDRFMTMCLDKGIKYFEMTHLFSQWGAEYAPKIYAYVDGTETKIFGWHTRADSEEYKTFLNVFLKALQVFLQEKGWEELCHFHISDEPNLSNIEHYSVARNIIKDLGFNAPVFDALSEFEFYKRGLVDVPVASTDHIATFIEHKVEDLWAYYCCCEYREGLSNRFMNMPGLRTRVIGLQLYKAGVKGFLHWGYNHWYGHKCLNMEINPYTNTDADRGFPSGDAFLVYPGKQGPVSSIRLKQLQLAFQDVAACVTLEKKIGRDAVVAMIDLVMPIDFKNYPHEDNWFLSLREKINKEIERVYQA